MNSKECIVRNNTYISFAVPTDARSGMAVLYFDTVAIDSFYLGVNPVPVFPLSEIPAGKFLRGSDNSSFNEQLCKGNKYQQILFDEQIRNLSEIVSGCNG
ncbi:hypothetical protein MASR1M45_13310 [Candidatus Kapaibacterium sp.]